MNQTTASKHRPMAPLTITIDDAISWTKRWRKGDHHLQARSFTFDADEFRAIIHEHHVVKVRLYLGLQEIVGTEELIEKMICVGVDKDGNDIIHFVPSGTTTGHDHENEGTGIYDFSNPCPPLCTQGDHTSPLH